MSPSDSCGPINKQCGDISAILQWVTPIVDSPDADSIYGNAHLIYPSSRLVVRAFKAFHGGVLRELSRGKCGLVSGMIPVGQPSRGASLDVPAGGLMHASCLHSLSDSLFSFLHLSIAVYPELSNR